MMGREEAKMMKLDPDSNKTALPGEGKHLLGTGCMHRNPSTTPGMAVLEPIAIFGIVRIWKKPTILNSRAKQGETY